MCCFRSDRTWGHLYVEFRGGRLSGFRYLRGSWLPQKPPPRSTPFSALQPRLATGEGISLGSTLGQLRSAYGRVTLAGTDRWQAAGGGLVFYDNAERDPPPGTSCIVEIKYGTCGDF